MSNENTPVDMVVHAHNLSFTIVAKVYEYRVDFTIYDIEGWAFNPVEGEFNRPLWRKAGAANSPSATETLAEAEPYLHGTVKWDGCSNWKFDEQDRVMLHGCSKADIQRFGDVMAMCWDLAADNCPMWNAC